MKFGNDMSRIAKLPIIIPSGTTVQISGQEIIVKGPVSQLAFVATKKVVVGLEDNTLTVRGTDPTANSLAGMSRTMISNMVRGVTEGWTKTLELNGTGYRASTTGSQLQLALGFSHPVNIPAPGGISFEVKDNKITIKGADKGLVGEIAAKIRALRPADPYKAKGFKYENEVIIKKAGKAAKAGAGK